MKPGDIVLVRFPHTLTSSKTNSVQLWLLPSRQDVTPMFCSLW